MGLDPSIFLQGAQLQAQNDAQTRATIGNFFDKLAESKKAKPLELEQAAQEYVYRKSIGAPTTPELEAKAKAYDVFNTSKYGINPATGETFPQNRSIFDTMQGMGGGQYPQGGLYGPPSMQTGGFVPPDVAANMGRMPPSVPNGPYNNDLGQMIPLGDNYAEVAGMTPDQRTQKRMGASLPAPANNKQAQTTFEAATNIAKDSEIDANKQQMAQDIEVSKIRKTDIDTIPVLRDMLTLNEDTVDAPYAGSGPVKMVTRGYDAVSGKNTTGPMDLLQQNRLDIAAPLAKQLGVNPTDSDFQNTLNRIFDANASKVSRKNQIENLIKKIERRQNLTQRGFEDTANPTQTNPIKAEIERRRLLKTQGANQ